MKNIIQCTKYTVEMISKTKSCCLNKLIKVVDINVTDQVKKKREASRITHIRNRRCLYKS